MMFLLCSTLMLCPSEAMQSRTPFAALGNTFSICRRRLPGEIVDDILHVVKTMEKKGADVQIELSLDEIERGCSDTLQLPLAEKEKVFKAQQAGYKVSRDGHGKLSYTDQRTEDPEKEYPEKEYPEKEIDNRLYEKTEQSLLNGGLSTWCLVISALSSSLGAGVMVNNLVSDTYVETSYCYGVFAFGVTLLLVAIIWNLSQNDNKCNALRAPIYAVTIALWTASSVCLASGVVLFQLSFSFEWAFDYMIIGGSFLILLGLWLAFATGINKCRKCECS